MLGFNVEKDKLSMGARILAKKDRQAKKNSFCDGPLFPIIGKKGNH